MRGYLVVDKPAGLTSHDIVGIVRAVTGFKKVGHTGTLDPFATGVLPVAIGKATRFIQYLDEGVKVYDATIDFSGETDTADVEGDITRTAGPPDWSRVSQVLDALVGEQDQTPPAYSAVKVDGKPLYKYARAGVEKAAKPRRIRVYEAHELGRTENTLRVRLACSRGTYVRVLGQDIARELGSAGHLSALRRVASGRFGEEGASSLDALAERVAGIADWRRVFRGPRDDRPPRAPRAEVQAWVQPRLVSLEEALAYLPSVAGDPAILQGAQAPPPPSGLAKGQRYTAVHDGRLLAVAESHGRFGKVLLRA